MMDSLSVLVAEVSTCPGSPGCGTWQLMKPLIVVILLAVVIVYVAGLASGDGDE